MIFIVVAALVVIIGIGAMAPDKEPSAATPSPSESEEITPMPTVSTEPAIPSVAPEPSEEPSIEPSAAPSEAPSEAVTTQPSKAPGPAQSVAPATSQAPAPQPSEEPKPTEEALAPSVDPQQAFRDSLKQYNYVGSSGSDKYHYPTCRWTSEINDQNLVYWNTVEEAQAAGYSACGTCHPK